MTDRFRFFAPFTKVDDAPDGSIYVHARINDETVDDEGEVMDYAGTKAALEDFMKWANVREMHEHSAVGTVESITHDDLAKASEGILHIVDPTAVLKVKAKVYKGTSLGGSKGTDIVLEKVAGQSVKRIRRPLVKEISLVDRPSRPTAELTLMKLSDADVADPPTAGGPTVAKSANTSEGKPISAADQAAAAENPTPQPPAESPRGESEAPEVTQGPGPDNAGDAQPAQKIAATGDLGKAAADDLVSGDLIAEQLARLIEQEQAEGDTAKVGPLQAALAAIQEYTAGAAAELATPENVAEAVQEAAVEEAVDEVLEDLAFAYSAVIADLAKRAHRRLRPGKPATLAKVGKRNAAKDQATIQQIHDLAVAAGAVEGDGESESSSDAGEGEGAEGGDAAAKLAKVASEGPTPEAYVDQLLERLPLAKVADLDALRDAFLEAVRPLQADLAKLAAQPMPGGPARYASHPLGLAPGEAPQVSQALGSVLAKVSDPTLREELGIAIAAQEIAAAQGR